MSGSDDSERPDPLLGGIVLKRYRIMRGLARGSMGAIDLAPELREGGEPSASSDVDSAAVVLHEPLAGRNKLRAASPAGTLGRVLAHVPTRLDAIRDHVARELADVVEAALRKRPSERFASAVEVSSALRARGQGALRARPGGRGSRRDRGAPLEGAAASPSLRVARRRGPARRDRRHPDRVLRRRRGAAGPLSADLAAARVF
jgi:serine/threonine-protein kinase